MKTREQIRAYLEGIKTTKDFNRGVNGIYSEYQKGMIEAIGWILNESAEEP